MAYKCVVFDFDGTLADTEEKAFNIYNELATKYKYSTVTMEELQHIKNLHVKEIKEIVDIPFYQFPRALRDGQKMMRKESNEIHAFAPDIHAFFTALRRETKHIGILTSNIKKTVSDFLITYDISHEIEFIMCSALMSKSKKIKKVLRKHDIKPSEMLYIGDEVRDIEACHKVGVDVAAVNWGYNTPLALEKCKPTFMIDNIWKVIDIVKTKNDH
ncbi:HAD hydrolase-like protein [Acetobacterium wieringae]|jgi:phosphoglycolate phosphatase|uniref:HAD hydrolase-like protein n=2 Tax=Acetobacterium wieringae TaxID=52694 RepID=A0A1F2PIT7_9FIRM|nr:MULTISPECIES: HAD hydrolase-like protein [Acetobacterium]MEA4805197.1 HAD hydrolase-like protein [Acetobacterium wieringae]OFV70641.1 pyrophosphatase PpaX [Acetobacterium wieringae]UYO61449.1 HAD hydrolase-like protein [Acetobacterium wieringae]VUZ28594.1 Phosphoglycolate phosphatase [Acetobacterium wieringae]